MKKRGIDDIAKAIAKALEESGMKGLGKVAGKAAKKPSAAERIAKRGFRAMDPMTAKAGKEEMILRWSKLGGAKGYADEAAKTGKTVGERAAGAARSRGIENRAKAMGARQEKNPTKALADAAAAKERKVAYKQAGGKNSKTAMERRQVSRANANKRVRKDIKKNKPK